MRDRERQLRRSPELKVGVGRAASRSVAMGQDLCGVMMAESGLGDLALRMVEMRMCKWQGWAIVPKVRSAHG